MFQNDFLQFFEAAEKPAGGSPAGEPGSDKIDSDAPEVYIDPGAREMFGDSPLTLDQLIKEDNPEPAGKPEVKKPAEEVEVVKDEPIQGTEEPAEKESPVPAKEAVKSEEVSQPEAPSEEMYLIPEISDKEISKEQIVQAFQTHQNLEKWRTNLTQRGQLQSVFESLPPEEQSAALERLKPIIYGKSPIPKGIDSSKPITIKTKDTDGYDIEVVLNWDAPEVKAIGEQIRAEMEKEYEPTTKELKAIKAEKIKADNAVGAVVLSYFLDNHPEIDIRDPNQQVWNAMDTIARAGESHPKFSNFLKLNTLMSTVVKNNIFGPDSMERAYKLLFGGNGDKLPKKQKTPTADERILEEQKKRLGVGPGVSAANKTEEERILERSVDQTTKAHLDLIEEALNKKAK